MWWWPYIMRHDCDDGEFTDEIVIGWNFHFRLEKYRPSYIAGKGSMYLIFRWRLHLGLLEIRRYR
jgi:hypothetical protein